MDSEDNSADSGDIVATRSVRKQKLKARKYKEDSEDELKQQLDEDSDDKKVDSNSGSEIKIKKTSKSKKGQPEADSDSDFVEVKIKSKKKKHHKKSKKHQPDSDFSETKTKKKHKSRKREPESENSDLTAVKTKKKHHKKRDDSENSDPSEVKTRKKHHKKRQPDSDFAEVNTRTRRKPQKGQPDTESDPDFSDITTRRKAQKVQPNVESDPEPDLSDTEIETKKKQKKGQRNSDPDFSEAETKEDQPDTESEPEASDIEKTESDPESEIEAKKKQKRGQADSDPDFSEHEPQTRSSRKKKSRGKKSGSSEVALSSSGSSGGEWNINGCYKKKSKKNRKQKKLEEDISRKGDRVRRQVRYNEMNAGISTDDDDDDDDDSENGTWGKKKKKAAVEVQQKRKISSIMSWRWMKEQASDGVENTSYDSSEKEFFVHWQGKSYWDCTWVSTSEMAEDFPVTLRTYVRKTEDYPPPIYDQNEDELEDAQQGKHRKRKTYDEKDIDPLFERFYKYGIQPQWLLIDRIINHDASGGRGKANKYLIKWKDVPYDHVSWLEVGNDVPGFKEAVDKYNEHRQNMKKKSSQAECKYYSTIPLHPSRKNLKTKYTEDPSFVDASKGLKLHEYQLEGLNWLRHSWTENVNTILADEMGLGKTIQTIMFLYSLYREGYCRGPFLISAPLSTIINWEREFDIWAPELYVVTYAGLQESRIVIRKNEMSFDDQGTVSATLRRVNGPAKFHVLLTSYEYVSKDITCLSSIKWAGLVVDEAHRLKNNQSLFFKSLNRYKIDYKLLLTGTPLQNNLEELYNLLNFLCPTKFDELEKFLSEFSDISKEDQVKKLHDMLGPHMLRRLKADVLKNMPSKSEFLVRVELSAMQKKYYKYILTKNFSELNSKVGGHQTSLRMIMMDLKKCCNHPYLFSAAQMEAAVGQGGIYELTALTKASGKLVLLGQMLKILKQQGHRVLIFSQMTRMMDLLEDFLEGEGYLYERIDGGLTGNIRQEAIDRFNAPGSKKFVFILSTRAGGLGINLATADTVIIYDSDWNPHNDIQAFSRAHRIGQQNKVMIYRFVTRNSIEERIAQVAKKKMLLTHLVVRPGMGKGDVSFSKQELADILRFGTEDLFKEKDDKKTDETLAIHYTEEAVKELLDRTKDGVIEEKESGINDYLSSFKVASYATKQEQDNEEEPEIEVKPKKSANLEPNYWAKLLGQQFVDQQNTIIEKQKVSLGKGKRARKTVNYNHVESRLDNEIPPTKSHKLSDRRPPTPVDTDSDFSIASVEDDASDDEESGVDEDGVPLPKTKSMDKVLPPLLFNDGQGLEVLGFNAYERKEFLDAVMRFGMPPQENFNTQWCVRALKRKPDHELRAYTSLFMNHLVNPRIRNKLSFLDGVPIEGLSPPHVMCRIGIMALIRKKVLEYEEGNGDYSMPDYIDDLNRREMAKRPPQILKPNSPKPKESDSGSPDSIIILDDADTIETASADSTTLKTQNDDEIKVKPNESDAGDPDIIIIEDEAAKNNSTHLKAKKETEDETILGSPVPSSGTTIIVEPYSNKNDDFEFKLQEPVNTTETDEKSELCKNETAAEEKSMENGTSENKELPETNVPEEQITFDIGDGNFTELHTIWANEEKARKTEQKEKDGIWSKKHDYWLLAGCLAHGYSEWYKIQADPRYEIINEPFKMDKGNQDLPKIKSRFYSRRFKLLEKALVIEEQLNRTHRSYTTALSSNPHVEERHVLDEASGEMVKQKLTRSSHTTLHQVLVELEGVLCDINSDSSRVLATTENMPPKLVQRLQMAEPVSQSASDKTSDENTSGFVFPSSYEGSSTIGNTNLAKFQNNFTLPPGHR